MNIFLDCGANWGQGLQKIMKLENMGQDWLIYTFEPNPAIFPNLLRICGNMIDMQATPLIVPIQAAVGTKTGQADFWIGNHDDGGSSLIHDLTMQTNKGKEPETKISAKVLSLKDFIRLRTCEEDSIVLKLDIEGSEYEILEDLLDSDYEIHRIKRVYCEFHERFLPERVGHAHLLRERLKEANVDIIDWD